MNFSDVNVGDKVIIRRSAGGQRIAVVTKVLKDHFIVDDNLKFRKASGSQVGGDSWYFCWVEKATDERIKEVTEENKRTKIIQYLSNYKYGDLPLETLEAIIKLISNAQPKDTTNDSKTK